MLYIRANTMLALLFDGDNVPPSCAAEVLELARARGRVIVSRVYGDFSRPNLHGWREACQEHSIEPIMVWAAPGKNSTDMRCCRDAVEMRDRFPHIDTYVLVTGDSDFTVIVGALKAANKYVIGAHHAGGTSDALKRSCDEFWITDVPRARAPSEDETSSDEENAGGATKEASGDMRGLVRKKIVRMLRASGTLTCSAVKTQLLREDPTHVATNCGYTRFNDMLRAMGFQVFTNNGGCPYVRLALSASEEPNARERIRGKIYHLLRAEKAMSCGAVKVELLRDNEQFVETNCGHEKFSDMLRDFGFHIFVTENGCPFVKLNKFETYDDITM